MNSAGLASRAADTNLSPSATMTSGPDLVYTNAVKNSVTKIVPLCAGDGGIQGGPLRIPNTGATVLDEITINVGWKVGLPITNYTYKGTLPVWSTVRQRFWKNVAAFLAKKSLNFLLVSIIVDRYGNISPR